MSNNEYQARSLALQEKQLAALLRIEQNQIALIEALADDQDIDSGLEPEVITLLSGKRQTIGRV